MAKGFWAILAVFAFAGILMTYAVDGQTVPPTKQLGKLTLRLTDIPMPWRVDVPSMYAQGGCLSCPASITNDSIRLRAGADVLKIPYSRRPLLRDGTLWPQEQYVSLSVGAFGLSGKTVPDSYLRKNIRGGLFVENASLRLKDKHWDLHAFVNPMSKPGDLQRITWISDDYATKPEPSVVCIDFAPLKPEGIWQHDEAPQDTVECRVRLRDKGAIIGVSFSAQAWRQTTDLLTQALEVTSVISHQKLTPN